MHRWPFEVSHLKCHTSEFRHLKYRHLKYHTNESCAGSVLASHLKCHTSEFWAGSDLAEVPHSGHLKYHTNESCAGSVLAEVPHSTKNLDLSGSPNDYLIRRGPFRVQGALVAPDACF